MVAETGESQDRLQQRALTYAGRAGSPQLPSALTSAQIVARAINQRRVVDGLNPIADLNDSGVTQHQFKTVSAAEVRAGLATNAEEQLEEDLDVTKIIDVPDLIGVNAHKSTISVKTKRVVHFVVMSRLVGESGDWQIPAQADFDAFNCHLEASIATPQTCKFVQVYKWGNTSGGVGILGLLSLIHI